MQSAAVLLDMLPDMQLCFYTFTFKHEGLLLKRAIRVCSSFRTTFREPHRANSWAIVTLPPST
eukprot:145852-Amphidinium_carterae.1